MPSRFEIWESKRKAEEWANSFVVGERVEIRARGKYSYWEPGIILGKWTSRTWPVLWLQTSHGEWYPFRYADRERIWKVGAVFWKEAP